MGNFEQELLFDDENIETEEDLGIQDLNDYSKAVLWGTDWTSETIVNQLIKKNIQLNPEFQRRDAWDITKKSRFIESLILGLPVPPIILAENNEKKNSYIVIDGKQRLLSIMQFCADKESEFQQLKLYGLEILPKINGYSYIDIENANDKNDYKTQFDNQTIRTVVIRNWKNEKFLYTVFLRLNTGSLKLSPQELRQALHPGEFLSFVNDYSIKSKGIKEVLKLTKPDPRMRDVELIIRYFSFKNFENDYKGNLKEFLDDSCKKLNKDWKENNIKYLEQVEDLEKAIDFTTSIFGEKNRFSKYLKNGYTNIFNRTIFDIMTLSFSDEKIRTLSQDFKKNIKEEFEKIMINDKRFIESTSGSTKDLDKTTDRIKIWRDALYRIIEK